MTEPPRSYMCEGATIQLQYPADPADCKCFLSLLRWPLVLLCYSSGTLHLIHLSTRNWIPELTWWPPNHMAMPQHAHDACRAPLLQGHLPQGPGGAVWGDSRCARKCERHVSAPGRVRRGGDH